jgi:hypothetical protein
MTSLNSFLRCSTTNSFSRSMVRLGVCFAIAVVDALLVSSAGADIIDTFTNVEGGNTDVATISGAGSQTIDFTITPTVSDPLGSRRRLQVQQFAQVGSATLTVDGTSGEAALTSAAGSTSKWTIVYGVGLFLNFDATAGGADSFRLTFTSHSPLLEYQIGAYGTGGGGTSNNGTWQKVVGNVVDVPFSSFSNLANIDFTNLIQMDIRIEDVQTSIPFGSGGSAQLTQFETVPEPVSVTLFAIGGVACVALAVKRHRKRCV